jgi:FkbM family methyltransferase
MSREGTLVTKSSHRFGALGIAVVVLLSMAIGFAASWWGEPLQRTRARILGAEGAFELEPLAARYGAKNSRFAEEWIIRDFFQDRRDGVFLDVGANEYRSESNTYFLETALGWSGIAIDAQEEFAAGFKANRPRTRFFALFVSDASDTTIDFFIPDDRPGVASFTRSIAAGPAAVRKVPTITLNDLLARERITRLDFMSMDIELAEPRALAGFDIERYMPALVCIESHSEVRQPILDYFARHHYVVAGKYLRMDTQNLYFVPIPPTPAAE